MNIWLWYLQWGQLWPFFKSNQLAPDNILTMKKHKYTGGKFSKHHMSVGRNVYDTGIFKLPVIYKSWSPQFLKNDE